MPQALGRHEPAVGGAAGEDRVLGAEQRGAHVRVDAVGADQHVDVGDRAVVERDLDTVAVVSEAPEPVADMQALRRQGTHQRGQQVGAVGLVMREAERLDHHVPERRAQQRPPVVPAALVEGQRAHAHTRQVVAQAQAVEDARGVGADLDAGADLAERVRALVDVDVEPGLEQGQRRSETADAASDDADRELLPSDLQVLTDRLVWVQAFRLHSVVL